MAVYTAGNGQANERIRAPSPAVTKGTGREGRSLAEFLNLVRGANPRNPGSNPSVCQKTLEDRYGSGRVVRKVHSEGRGSGWEPVTKATMSELSGLVGGYLVPQDFSDKLLETVAEESFIYPRANVIPMYSADLQAPRINVETAPTAAGISPFFGGVQFHWGAEDVPAESEPTFRMDSFRAWDLLGYATVSNQWLQDAGAIQESGEGRDPSLKAEHYLLRLFSKAAAWTAEYAFLQGLGAGQRMPLGIVNSPARILVTRDLAGAISIVDIASMTSRLLPYSWNRGIWAVSPTALAQVQQIATYQVNQNYDVDKWRDNHHRPCGLLSSLPLFVTDKLPALGRKGDLVLFDPSLYVIAQRMEVVIDVSPDDLFITNQTVYRIWMRLDGKPEFSNTITLPDTTSTVSPYVVLNA